MHTPVIIKMIVVISLVFLYCNRDCVHVLTQQEINSGQYSPGDVVLPLLGTKSVLPSNKVADKYVQSQHWI